MRVYPDVHVEPRVYKTAIRDAGGAYRFGAVELPATPLAALGGAGFGAAHGVRVPYMAGAMANGIASVDLVRALARGGMLASFGAAGLPLAAVERALGRLQDEIPGLPYAVNLIHSPGDPQLEDALVDLLLARGVRLVEASAFLRLTLPVVRYRLTGIARGADGRVTAPNRIIAKVSRAEVATPFLSPAPPAMVEELVARGVLTRAQADLAARLPLAEDLTAEADSGGHTDNRPALALVPSMLALAARLAARFEYERAPRVGAAGGISTPAAVAAAFAMGAGYVVTGSVNQACVESGSSDLVRGMLAEASPADVAMAPAADMFEMGVKVQVLKRGTMFPMRAGKLFELYARHASLDEIPEAERRTLETHFFREPLAAVWDGVRGYFAARDPAQIARAEREPKYRMALVFRSYLGRSSHWANAGEADRRLDFQVWCGPAMGAFNEWTAGTALAAPDRRDVVTVAKNLLLGAAACQRAALLRAQGVRLDGIDPWEPLCGDTLDAHYDERALGGGA